MTGGDAWAHSLYFDFATGWIADHNVVFDALKGINLNDGLKHRIFNNTVFARSASISWGNALRNVELVNNIVSGRLPVDEAKDTGTFSPNLENAEPSLFENAKSGNFRLKGGSSTAIDQGVAVPPYTNEQFGDAPDLGAFEVGTEAWTAGADRPYRHAPPGELVAERQPTGAVQLHWADQATDERHYYIERAPALDATGWLQYEVVAELAPDTESFLDESAEAKANSVYYRVFADRSMYSNTARVVPTGLTLHLGFDKNLDDSAPNDAIEDTAQYFAGDSVSEPAVFSDDAAVGSGSIRFQAEEKSSVVVPHSAELGLTTQMAFTAWLKPQSTKNRSIIATKLDTTGSTKRGFSIRWQFNELIASVGYGVQRLGSAPADNTWTFLALVYDDGGWRVYFGGITGNLNLVYEEEMSNKLLNNHLPLYLGGSPEETDEGRFFNGLMDDVRLYHHGLTEEQLRAIMSEK